MEKKLEQMLGSEIVPDSRQTRMYETIDIYTNGSTVLYSFDSAKPLAPFFPTSTGFGIQTPNIGIPDFHDTFKQDRYDNLYGGHSTIRGPGGHGYNLPFDPNQPIKKF
ncbi:MAG: hypothetical protein U9Q69_05070 [Nanoarchaeota archaeon]|nr:hypothetical protein [Nanoarchaeota archaeon]